MVQLNLVEIQEIFLLSLKEFLPSAGRYSDKQLIARIGKEKLEEVSDQLLDFLASSCGSIDNRNEYLALTAQVIFCLGSYIEGMNLPVTVNTIANNIHLASHALDRAFPGYATAGFLKSIISPTKIKENGRQVVLVD